jgi:HNH endonuclease/AP2 domain
MEGRMRELTHDLLRERYDYDPETGSFTYRIKVAQRVSVGDEVGCCSKSATRPGGRTAKQCGINGRLYYVHQLIWMWMTGEPFPDGHQIDHINMDPWDNRWSNLRLATHSQNMINRKGWGRTGFKGVRIEPRGKVPKYVATIKVNGIKHYLGSYRTPEEAHAAYVKAARQLHGEFARVEHYG